MFADSCGVQKFVWQGLGKRLLLLLLLLLLLVVVVCSSTATSSSTSSSSSTTTAAASSSSRARLKRDDTRAETRFGLPAKRTSPFKLVGGGSV